MINKQLSYYSVLVSFVLLLTTSCTNNDFFNEYQTISDGWQKDKPVIFDFESLDTLKTYNAYLNLRTTNQYPYSNLFIFIKMTDPEGFTLVDTLQYQMANPDGSMMGNGFTDVKEHKLVWRKKLALKKQGVYTVELNHAMRKLNEVKGDQNLHGVTEVGLQLQ